MKAEIICIGTELLVGQIIDTNAAFLARGLADLGIDLFYKTTVGDNLERVVASFELAWGRADLLILSGGLGPTQDDLTREALAAFLHEELQFNKEAWEAISAYFNKIQRSIAENNRRQAMLPNSGKMIPNDLGTAPGVLIEKDSRFIIALPGVPFELINMWGTFAIPYLKSLMIREGNPVLTSKFIKMVGIGESAMEERILDLIRAQSNPTIAPYAGKGEVMLRVSAKSMDENQNFQLIESAVDQIKRRLDPYIYGYDTDTLELVIGRLLKSLGWRLAIAESCTGGLIAHRITNIPGSSDYFLGGVTCYSNQLKIDLVGVSAQVLTEYGAVSSETAGEMAIGIKNKTGAEISLAVTGIAGPTGGSPSKPVGLVYFAISLPGKIQIEKRIFPFDRINNKEVAAQTGLSLLWQYLKSSEFVHKV